MRTVVKNIGWLATPQGNSARKGEEQGQIQYLKDTYVVMEEGIITEVGPSGSSRDWAAGYREEILDAQGRGVTPGLVDAHTHLVFAGWRQQELPLKLKGLSYLEILAQGGGILHTVSHTRKASKEELISQGLQSLQLMAAHGTTTCEVKSGYGLTVEAEIKCLETVEALRRLQPVELVATFMGAHALPGEFKNHREGYIRLVCEEMIPKAAPLSEFCDVFCEQGVFSVEESRRILTAGQEYGLKSKIHAEEMTALGGAQLAGEIGALSAEHLIHASDEGLAVMAKHGVIAVLLPGTSFYLGEPFARAKEMIKREIPVAIASDFNPGSCPNESLQLPMNLACLKYRMTPEEALTAVTLNGAAALHRAGEIGSIEVGKQGDLAVWRAPDINYLFYHWGVNQVHKVIKKGRVIV